MVARQFGSAAALASVVQALQAEARTDCLILGLGHAAGAWAGAGIAAQTVSSFAEALPYLLHAHPSLLVTGTSFNAQEDGHFWRWAKEQGIPSLAFVDHWVNYCQRFSSAPDRPFDCLPEHIAVLDDSMAARLVAVGCPADRVVVLGHPAWDDLVQRRGRCDVTLQARLAGDRVLVLFASEPIARFYGKGLGYTEGDALSLLLAALETVGEDRKESYVVAVKPHPTEDRFALTDRIGMAGGRVAARLVEGDRRDLISASTLVVGMNSLLLHEATIMGKPVIALQPGRLGPYDWVDHQPGILLATDWVQAISALHRALVGDTPVVPAPRPVIPEWIRVIDALIG